MSRRQRWLVYGSLAVIALALLATSWFLRRPLESRGDLAWTAVDFSAYPEVDLLRRYLRVNTSPTTGSELAGAEFLAAELRAMGLEPHIERLGEKGANLWAVLEGESHEALVLHNHIDVTPADDLTGWDFPPYGAVIDHLWLYGRGAFDMKSVTSAQLLALADLTKREKRPRRSVVFLATGSEEVGSQLGTRWILDQHPEIRDRAWAVLTEGGVLEPKSLEEIKFWGVEFAQKRFLEGSLCASNRQQLAERAREILFRARQQTKPRLVPEVSTFIAAYADSRENLLYREALAEPWRVLDDPQQFGSLPPYIQALFRDEIYFQLPEKDSDGDNWSTRFVIHLLPGSDPEAVKASFLPDWLTHGLTVTFRPAPGSEGGSATDHEAFVGLVEVVEEEYPSAPVGPFFLSFAATDARFFRQYGIPAYGFSPFVIFNTDTFRKDSPNERIGLPGYVMGVELYRTAVERLAG